jgi:saccharopine dehydrogenase-like NADP-dependent oxidoreductase
MKVFALGGYGKVGFPAIKLLAQSDLVTEIAVVGRSLERAARATTEIGEKAIAIHANGTDEHKLTSLVAGYDIIMNAATNEAVLPAMLAATRTGAHYCDVSFGGVLDQALQLSAAAEAAGITSVLANGVHPSVTNLMGVYVARQLEEVEQLQLGDASAYDFQRGRDLTSRQWLEEPRQSLTALREFMPGFTWMLQIVQESGMRTVRAYHDSQWVELDPIRSGVEVPLPQGGTIISYPYLSSDPLFGSLPRDLATVSPVEMLFSPLPPQLHDVLRELSLRVLLGKHRCRRCNRLPLRHR